MLSDERVFLLRGSFSRLLFGQWRFLIVFSLITTDPLGMKGQVALTYGKTVKSMWAAK